MRNHSDCNRKWYFDKIVFPRDDTDEGTASTKLGTEVHANIEDFFNDAGALDHPLLTFNTFVHMVKGSDVERRIEWEFLDETSFKVAAKGYIDLVTIDHDNKKIAVIDHKTTKDWKYSKKEDELRDDPQALLYLWVAYQEFGEGWNYSFSHHVILTKKAEPERITTIEVTTDQIKKGKKALDEMIAGMVHDSKALDHTFVDHNNYRSCYKFGKCQFWDYCKGEKKVPSIAEALAAKKGMKVEAPAWMMEGPPVEVKPSDSIFYVDCLPNNLKPLVQFEDFVADLVVAYQDEVGENYLITKYNEGCKAVALQAHKEVLEGKRKMPGSLFGRSSNPAVIFFSNFHAANCMVVKGI